MAGRGTIWARGAREGHASVDVGFRLADRDKRVAAGVLAGGVAYRFFFWLLSLFVLVIGGLGFGDSQRVEDALRAAGLDQELSQAVLDSWQNTTESRWWLLVTGAWLVLWTGYLAAKALVLVHGAVWGVVPPTGRNPLAASLAFTGTVLVFTAAVALARWLRHESPGIGLLATLSVVIIPFVLWIAASRALPPSVDTWRDLVPGAVLFAVGVQGLHLFTIFYLSPKLSHATQLNGLLGIVGTMLFWLYIAARLVVGAATLNASLWERAGAGRRDSEPGTAVRRHAR